jgi:hypothetical protein
MKITSLLVTEYRLMTTHLKVFFSTFVLASLTYVGFSRTLLLVIVSLFSVLITYLVADFLNPLAGMIQRIKEKWGKK